MMKPKVLLTTLFVIIIGLIGFLSVINIKSFLSSQTKTTTPPKVSLEKPRGLIAWGDNSWGQYGSSQVGNSGNSTIPYSQTNIENIAQLASGAKHSLALTQDGAVWAWGSNQYGQIATEQPDISTPVKLNSLPKTKKISASQFHSLALDENGRVWVWGRNFSGQLGDGTNNDNSSPQQIPSLSDITDIAAGHRFSLALKDDGTVWAWGAFCSPDTKRSLQQVLGDLSLQISQADDYYDPIDTVLDDTNDFDNCLSEEFVNIRSLTPIKISGLTDVKQISGGFGHILALKKDGTIWAWGCNKYGQVGNGTFQNSQTNKHPQQVLGLDNVVAISAGFRHSLALKSDGTVWTWGHNVFGELGDGSTADKSTPVLVQNLSSVEKISSGYDYSIAMTKGGKIFGWGQSIYGQLSPNYGLENTLPIHILGLENVEHIAAGVGHVVAFKQ